MIRDRPSPGNVRTDGHREPPPHTPATIRPLAADELDRIEPLWRELHEHHMRISPRLAGMRARSGAESWARRRANYARWIQDPDTLVLVAELDDELMAYAFVTVASGYSSWNSGPRLAELATLSVMPSMRGEGLGSRLLDAVRTRLADAGIEHLSVTAASTNDQAHRFYVRHGFRHSEVVFVGTTSRGD